MNIDRLIEQQEKQVGIGTSTFIPRSTYTAQAYQNDKYNVKGLSYPEDLSENVAYGNNKVIFYINVSVDSKIGRDTTVGTVTDGVSRDRGALLAGEYTTAQAAVGAAGTGAALGGLAGTIAGFKGGTTPKGKVAGGAIKGVGGAAIGALPGLASVAAVSANQESTPGAEKQPSFSRAQKRLQAAIALYIPNQLNIRYSAGWGEEDTATFQAFARGAQEVGRATSGDVSRTGGLVKEILGAKALQEGPQGAALGIGSGLAVNPKKEQAFKNVDFRTFTFDYQFAPRSESESQNVLNIIRAFKYHMHPEMKDNGFLYVYPSEFDIVYYKNNEENLNIHRHTSCVLTEMNVNYTPNGVFSTFPNGMPTQITMSLTFKELALLTKELIEKYT